jgi:Resolvase, N terminal domain
MNRAAGYIRVSTEEQAKHGLSLDEQQRLIREAAGDDVRMFVDAGLSGKREVERPAYQAMLAAAAAGELEAVYVWKLDRLGRDAEELLRARRMLGAQPVFGSSASPRAQSPRWSTGCVHWSPRRSARRSPSAPSWGWRQPQRRVAPTVGRGATASSRVMAPAR